MSDTNTKKGFSAIIIYLTVLWLFLTLFIGFKGSISQISPSESRYLIISEWGDFLAGFSAPLIFLWVGYGITIQRKEFSKAIDAFDNQRVEFGESVKLMRDQVEQIEKQHIVTWFNRNVSRLKDYLELLAMGKFDSPLLIHAALKRENIKDNKHIFDDIKAILDLDEFISDTLKNHKQNNTKLHDTINEINDEYNILHKEDILYCKKIYWKISIFVSLSKDYDEYKHYSNYSHWFNNDSLQNILELINESTEISLDDKIDDILVYEKFETILFKENK